LAVKCVVVVVVVSAVTFLEYWKRKNASLAHHWDCLDYEEEEVSETNTVVIKCPKLRV